MQQIDTSQQLRFVLYRLPISLTIISLLCHLYFFLPSVYASNTAKEDSPYPTESKRHLASINPLKFAQESNYAPKSAMRPYNAKVKLQPQSKRLVLLIAALKKWDLCLRQLDKSTYDTIKVVAWRVRRFLALKFESFYMLLREFNTQLKLTPLDKPYFNNY